MIPCGSLVLTLLNWKWYDFYYIFNSGKVRYQFHEHLCLSKLETSSVDIGVNISKVLETSMFQMNIMSDFQISNFVATNSIHISSCKVAIISPHIGITIPRVTTNILLGSAHKGWTKLASEINTYKSSGGYI